MKWLLHLKHWQLFLLIVICGAWVSPSPLREIVNSVSVITLFSWIYSIGVYGQDRIAEMGLKIMNLKLFKTNMVIVGISCVVVLVHSAITKEPSETSSAFGFTDIIFSVVAFYFVFAIFHTIFFVCKTIAKVEYRREVRFSDYFDYFFFMASVIIGIWVLQPKVNRLIAPKEEVMY
jgi:hypothetical protein